MFKTILVAMTVVAAATTASEKTVYTEYQCWSVGNQFRVMFEDQSQYLVESRIGFGLKLDESLKGEAGEAKLEFVGHVAFAKFVEGLKTIGLFDGYAHLRGSEIASALSPRARKYKDTNYFRFKNIEGVAQTAHDGGGLNGYLVINKKLLKVGSAAETFDAHYVFQHGDHTGGTLDYTCKKE